MQCCRKPEVKALLMKCAQNLVQRLNSEIESWPFFYEDAMNSIKLNQCPNESHSLIQKLMQLEHYKDLDIFLNLYTNKRMKISEVAIKTLSVLLKLKPQSSDTRLDLLHGFIDQDNIGKRNF